MAGPTSGDEGKWNVTIGTMIQRILVTRHPLPILPSLGSQNSICVILSASAGVELAAITLFRSA